MLRQKATKLGNLGLQPLDLVFHGCSLRRGRARKFGAFGANRPVNLPHSVLLAPIAGRV
jgi:hypothetical protein